MRWDGVGWWWGRGALSGARKMGLCPLPVILNSVLSAKAFLSHSRPDMGPQKETEPNDTPLKEGLKGGVCVWDGEWSELRFKEEVTPKGSGHVFIRRRGKINQSWCYNSSSELLLSSFVVVFITVPDSLGVS